MQKLTNFFKGLTKIGEDESLGKFSLILVLMLDVFLFFAITEGINQNTKQLTNEHEYVPELCREIVIEKDLPEKIGDRIGYILLENKRTSNDYWYSGSNYEFNQNKKTHPICNEYAVIVKNLKENSNIISLFEDRAKLNKDYRDIEIKIKNIYNTENKDLVKDIIASNNKKYKKLNDIQVEIDDIDTKISSNKEISRLYELTNGSQKEILNSDLKRFRFWFPIKEFGIELAFLLPLFVVLFFWFTRNLKKEKSIQLLVSSHALTVVSIPILFEVIHIIYNILPKTIFREIINILSTLHLIAIWHYLLIGLAILIVMFIIYFVQKKCFNKEIITRKRLSKLQCIHCGQKIPVGSRFCISCGKSQYIKCKKCGKDTFANSKFCKECGEIIK